MENCIEVNGNDREVHRSVMEELERVCGEKGILVVKNDTPARYAIAYSSMLRILSINKTIASSDIMAAIRHIEQNL